jgi:hypothetical protein
VDGPTVFYSFLVLLYIEMLTLLAAGFAATDPERKAAAI